MGVLLFHEVTVTKFKNEEILKQIYLPFAKMNQKDSRSYCSTLESVDLTSDLQLF